MASQIVVHAARIRLLTQHRDALHDVASMVAGAQCLPQGGDRQERILRIALKQLDRAIDSIDDIERVEQVEVDRG